MALDTTKVRSGATGVISVAPTGTTLPTNATATLNVAFEDLGYISEEGIVESINADITDLKAWQLGTIVRKIQTSHDVTYAFAPIEFNPVAVEAYFGNYTDEADGASWEITAEQLPHRIWVIDVLDGEVRMRFVIPDGQVTERGDFNIVNGELMSMPLTLSCFPDTTGVKAYGYIDESIITSS